MKKIITITFLLLSLHIVAQDKIEITDSDYENQGVEMADQFRANGKIYVVVAVILIIMAGMFFYLFRMEKKIKKLENDINSTTTTQSHDTPGETRE